MILGLGGARKCTGRRQVLGDLDRRRLGQRGKHGTVMSASLGYRYGVQIWCTASLDARRLFLVI
jgi:hypothetical protein